MWDCYYINVVRYWIISQSVKKGTVSTISYVLVVIVCIYFYVFYLTPTLSMTVKKYKRIYLILKNCVKPIHEVLVFLNVPKFPCPAKRKNPVTFNYSTKNSSLYF